ncbi:5464_t:CDS:2, partial [Paraglomus occultum]
IDTTDSPGYLSIRRTSLDKYSISKSKFHSNENRDGISYVDEVKNWANPPSQTQEQATGSIFWAKVMFDEDCVASIEANYIGVYYMW